MTLLGYSSYKLSYDKIENLIGERLESIAATAAIALDSKDHRKIVRKLFKNEQNIEKQKIFLEFQQKLQKLKEINKLKQDIYTVIINPYNKDEMIFVTMSSAKTYIGNSMHAHPLVKKVYDQKKSYHTSIYQDEEGKWISGFAPLVNKKNKVIAVLEVDFDVNEEIKLIQDELKQSFLFPVAIILLITILVSLLISSFMSKPLEVLLSKVQDLKGNKLDQENKTNSRVREFKTLHLEFDNMANVIIDSKNQLEDYAKNLELKVEQRTAELKESKDNIENILNNVSQGFLTFDSNGVIGADYSKVVEEIYDLMPHNLSFNKLIDPFYKFSDEEFTDWKDLAFSGVVDFESLVDLLPRQFSNNSKRIIHLQYNPIYSENSELLKIICISQDITQEVMYKNDSIRKEEYSKFIINLINNRDIFENYCMSFNTQIEECLFLTTVNSELNQDQVAKLSRYIHTIKGESGFNHIHDNVLLCDQIENMIGQMNADGSEEHKKEVKNKIKDLIIEMKSSFSNFLEENRNIVSSKQSESLYTKRKKEDIKAFLKRLDPQNKSKIFIKELDSFFIKEDAKEIFEKYSSLVKDLSDKEGKVVKLKVQTDGTRVDLQKYNRFIKSCIHLIRNAIDHGIESQEIRSSKNKKVDAEIKIDVKDIGTELLFSFSDDGGGINIDKIKETALSMNIISQEEILNLNDREITNLIFNPGFSTKEQVTLISGRGIGLDEVNDAVNSLNGRIEVLSKINEGTTFNIRIPK